MAPSGCFLGESIFVPSTNTRHLGSAIPEEREDEGYVVTLMYDGQEDRSAVIVLDARNVEAGPIAKINLRFPLPFAFHNGWSDTAYMP